MEKEELFQREMGGQRRICIGVFAGRERGFFRGGLNSRESLFFFL
jgi:hypothetical protein